MSIPVANMRLGNKGVRGSFQSWISVWVGGRLAGKRCVFFLVNACRIAERAL